MSLALLASLTPETELIIPIGVLCTFLAILIGATWRLANKMRDLTDVVRGGWTLRDMERWALQFERENRDRGNKIWVPDVVRAPKDKGAGEETA